MARGRLTIHDVPQELRSKYAARARKTLRDMQTHPGMTPQQLMVIQERLNWVSKWERADVGAVLPKEKAALALPSSTSPKALPAAPSGPARLPQHHSVEIAEQLTVTENPKA